MLARPTRSTVEGATLLLGLTLVACGCGGGSGGGAGGGDGGPDGSTVPTIAGLVIDEISGVPLAGATVVRSDGAEATTGAGGAFSFDDFDPPYDLSVRAAGTDHVRSFRGITISTPTLAARGDVAENTAMLSGSASADVAMASDRFLCFLDGPRELTGLYYDGSIVAGGTTWSMDAGGANPLGWSGASAIEGTIHCVIERRDADDVDTVLAAYHGALAVSLSSGAALTDLSVELSAVEIATVTGEVIDPEGVTVNLSVGPVFPSGRTYGFPLMTAGAFSRTCPILPGAELALRAVDGNERAATVIVPAAATVDQDLTLLARPEIVVPGPASTELAPGDAITYEGGAHLFLVELVVGDVVFDVLTSGDSAVLPDLAPFGLSYEAGASAMLTVVEYGRFETVDDAVVSDAYFLEASRNGEYEYARSTTLAIPIEGADGGI